jgi:hypothetical protein|nr:MAG TPA: DNA-directed RNA polymerase subunit [Caudoviricetes sp.]
MAKKITREPNIKRYKAKCPICECEFEFDTTDANWHLNEVQNDGAWGGLRNTITRVDCTVRCPTCGTVIENQQTEIPCPDR